MNTRKRALVFVTVAAFGLAGCTSFQDQPKTAGGSLVGAALGGWAGSKIGSGNGRLAATAAGALLGAFVGGSIGESLDRADRAHLARTTQATLESYPVGSTARWQNPDSGNWGTVTPTRTWQQPTGQYCREYQQSVTVGGRVEQAYGTACRMPDGSWQVANQSARY